ncbi:YihY family inner membrane protein, partial [Thiolapillus sp.]
MMKRFVEDGGLERAGSLAYTTLLSLVPLMTVVFAILSAFPIAEKVSDVVQEFIFRNFMPASGEVVHQYLLEFSSKASRLSGVGFLALLVVAVMLMATIDKTFNAIWSVKRKRRPLNMFLVYWAVLSMGPVLMGASVLATS